MKLIARIYKSYKHVDTNMKYKVASWAWMLNLFYWNLDIDTDEHYIAIYLLTHELFDKDNAIINIIRYRDCNASYRRLMKYLFVHKYITEWPSCFQDGWEVAHNLHIKHWCQFFKDNGIYVHAPCLELLSDNDSTK